MHSFKPITWDSSFNVGVVTIDEQHQKLVEIINEAGTKLEDGSTIELLEKIVNELFDYTLYHFETEEQLMNENDYASNNLEMSIKHLAQHREFASKILDIKSNIKSGKIIHKDELLNYLKDWLMNHIFHTDKRLGEYLKTKI